MTSCKEKLKSLQQELSQAQTDFHKCGPGDAQLAKSLWARIESLQRQVQLEEQNFEREDHLAAVSERERDVAELDMHKYEPVFEEAAALLDEEDEMLRAIAHTRTNYEIETAEKILNRERKKLRAQERKERERQEELERREQAAELGRRRGKERLREHANKVQPVVDRLNELKEQEYQDKITRLMDLKRTIETAQNKIRDANERKHKKEQKEQERRDAEFQELLSNGKNPYEVWRRREYEQKLEKDSKKALSAQRHRENEIVDRLLNENEYLKKREDAEKREKAYDEKYRRELGRREKEKRIHDYLVSRTVDGRDMVDPTGREFKIKPSQVTLIKNHAFGLGTANEAMINKQLNTLGHVGLDPRIVNESTLNRIRPNRDADMKASTFGGDSVVNRKSSQADDLDVTSGSENGKWVPKLSVLEQKMMEKARQRQKENIIQKQIVWGKEFKGTAFLCKPEVILFQDFDVGQTYTQRVVLTNVSYSFNSFKLLPLGDDTKDFFDIKYIPPGRMSAGMTCPLTITFMPKLNQDINTFLPLLCQTGPVNIPLQCKIKRSVVSVSTSVTPWTTVSNGLAVIDFGAVILGESGKKYLKFKNDGALLTDFRIVDREVDETQAIQRRRRSGFDDSNSGTKLVDEAQRDLEIHKHLLFTKPEAHGADAEAVTLLDSILEFQSSGQLSGYSDCTHEFVFTPSAAGNLAKVYTVKFSDADSTDLVLIVKGRGIDVPIYVASELYDLNICVYNHVYREEICLINRGSTAMKIHVEMPKEAKEFLDLNPLLGYIQANSQFKIQVKFTPTKEMLQSCAKFADADTEMINFPIKVVGANQVLPVPFMISARLTSDLIQFTPSVLDFGNCATDQTVSLPLTMKSNCRLPQQFAFVRLPRDISVEPEDGFGTLLPLETITRTVKFSPLTATTRQFDLLCKVQTGNICASQQTVTCRGVGVSPPLQLSHTSIAFPATPLAQCVKQSITVRNDSNTAQTFEFFPPPFLYSRLKVSPLVETLSPNSSVRVQIEFHATPTRDLLPPVIEEVATNPTADATVSTTAGPSVAAAPVTSAADKKAPPKITPGKPKAPVPAGKADKTAAAAAAKESEKEREERERKEREEAAKPPPVDHVKEMESTLQNFSGSMFESAPDEPWSRHCNWLIPIAVKSNGDNNNRQSTSSQFLAVQTVSVDPSLTTDTSKIDFGEIAVGRSVTVILKVRNGSNVPAILSMDALPPFGGFAVLNALRTIPPNGQTQLVIQFNPSSQQMFAEVLELRSETSRVAVRLKGRGVRPAIEISPSDGYINFGHTVSNNSVERVFKLKNCSTFALSYSLISQREGCRNFNGKEVFLCIPSDGVLKEGEEREVKVTFTPDHANENYFQQILVHVPNQEQERTLFLKGSAWNRSPYVVYDSIAGVPNMADLARKETERENSFAMVFEDTSIRRLTLKFPKTRVGEASAASNILNLVLGNCKMNNPKDDKSANFDLALEADMSKYFSVTPAKGALAVGTETKVAFKFSPPSAGSDILNTSSALAPLRGIGQWVETVVRGTLTGGAAAGIAQTGSDVYKFEVLLQGYVEQI
eukprot:GILJ01009584.1.p1 GENE.GILJ01009584.1~~GILJ01009584.1.p1  ORF type:complete len:1812 (-),score=327.15 GILJ01009584.1:58-4746(-)